MKADRELPDQKIGEDVKHKPKSPESSPPSPPYDPFGPESDAEKESGKRGSPVCRFP